MLLSQDHQDLSFITVKITLSPTSLLVLSLKPPVKEAKMIIFTFSVAPSSGKKKITPANQRKASPATKKTPTPTNSQKTMQRKISGPQQNRAQVQQQYKEDYLSANNGAGRNKREEQYKEYYSRNIEEITETNESQYERQRESAHNNGRDDQANYHNVYYQNNNPQKNKEILNEIQNIDDEINR